MEPNLYRVTFQGRKRGAIGIFYPIRVEIAAATPDQAIQYALAAFEPLSSTRAKLIAVTCPYCEQWQHLSSGDCMNECVRRGFAAKVG